MSTRTDAKLLLCEAIVLTALVLSVASPAVAKGPRYETSRAAKISNKFLRGVGNLTMGWVELPWNIHKEIQDLDPFTGAFTGAFKGVKMGAIRTVVGLWEIATFPLPAEMTLPIRGVTGYDPYVEPEFVMQDMDGRVRRTKRTKAKFRLGRRPARGGR